MSFDRHCAACHELNFKGRTEDQLPIPHALPWSEVRTLLAAKVLGGRVDGTWRMPLDSVTQPPWSEPTPMGERDPPESQTSSQDSDSQPPSPAQATSATKLTDTALDAFITSARAKCLKCHREEHLTEEFVAARWTGDHPSLIPRRWFRFGLFDHASHTDPFAEARMDCQYCHAVAPAPLATPPEAPLARGN
ncbi:MAG TPA: hypothetical protein VIY86_11070, partial [Pirellulaceae bacterium]